MEKLYFTSDRGGSPQIYRYDFGNGSVKRLTFKGSFNARGTLSADGKNCTRASTKW